MIDPSQDLKGELPEPEQDGAGALPPAPENPQEPPLSAVSRVHFTVEIPPGASLQVTVEPPVQPDSPGIKHARQTYILQNLEPQPTAPPEAPAQPQVQPDVPGVEIVYSSPASPHSSKTQAQVQPLRFWQKPLPEPGKIASLLFISSLLVYLLTRLIGITQFPIYFFSDEAVQVNLAADFVLENFHNADGELFPTFFYNVDKYSLGSTVYLHILPFLFFGKSVFVTRAVSAGLSILAALSAGLILRDHFKRSFWWGGVLLLSTAPAWFLHSRTAFETVAMVSFYSLGLACYLMYRQKDPKFLYPSLGLMALAFYSYNPGQAVVLITGVLLFFSDLRYHWQQRKVVLRGLGLVFLLALPYLRFWYLHPEAVKEHLYNLNSYWVQTMPLEEKLARFWDEYTAGLGPGYWFIPNTRDLVRHLMKGYGHLFRFTLPFFGLGLFLAIRDFRNPASRAVLAALLAAPAGAALAQMAVTRALVFVFPAAVLIGSGLSFCLEWLVKKGIPKIALSLALFLSLAGLNIWMLADALVNGPTWYREYDLGGMQYGAVQLFPAVEDFLQHNPGVKLTVSPVWANSVDVLARFFLGDPLPVQLGSVDMYLDQWAPLESQAVLVMTAAEYQKAKDSGKFSSIQVLRSVPYPDGRDGFLFTRLAYVPNIEEIIEAERQARRALLEAEVAIDGQLVQVRHSLLDLGEIRALWDGDELSVARTFEANPFQIELIFPEPRAINGLSLRIGDTDVRLQAQLFTVGEAAPIEFLDEQSGSLQSTWVSTEFGRTFLVNKLVLQVTDLRQGEPGHVHIWEIDIIEGEP